MNENYMHNQHNANAKRDRPPTCEYCDKAYHSDEEWFEDWEFNDKFCETCFKTGKQILNIIGERW